ncbi:MAG: LptF/LptG family permease [Cyanobacteria bacterium J06650_10]
MDEPSYQIFIIHLDISYGLEPKLHSFQKMAAALDLQNILAKKHLSNISLLDRYVLKQLVPPLLFSIAVFTLLGELIGITFEQIKFVAHDEISIAISIAVHLLKLPAFFSIGLPLALLLATLITCSDLSHKKETTALRAIGVSLFRMMLPILLLGLVGSGIAFIFHEVVVPPANYKVAMLLEKEWDVDRTELAKYNQREIVYLQYSDDKASDDKSTPQLSFAFFAHRFDGQKMQKITFFRYENRSGQNRSGQNRSHENRKIKEVIVSDAAQWNEKKGVWEFLSGQKFLLNSEGAYQKISLFEKLPLPLTRDIFDYANHTRDPREMNIIELYRRLNIVRNTGRSKQVRQLQMNIQERYAFPFSGFVFAYLGACIGFTTGNNAKSNSFGIAILIILAFYALQFLSSYLGMAGVIPVIWGAWVPNSSGLVLGSYATYRCT